MTSARSKLESFDHGLDVIYVHAYKSVLNGWAIDVTVVSPREGRPTATFDVVPRNDLHFQTSEEALAAGERLARAYLDEQDA